MVQPYPFPFRIVPSLTCISEVLRPPPMFSQQPFTFCTIPHAIRLKFTVRQIARNKRFLCSLPRLLESRFNGELTAPRFWEEASSLPRDAVTGREKYTYYWIKWKTTEWRIEWWTSMKWKTVLQNGDIVPRFPGFCQNCNGLLFSIKQHFDFQLKIFFRLER